MNEREELLKQFNDNFEFKQKDIENVQPYRATTNFNTALNQPNININSATNVNIKDSDGINNSMGVNNLMTPETINANNGVQSNNVQTIQEPINVYHNNSQMNNNINPNPNQNLINSENGNTNQMSTNNINSNTNSTPIVVETNLNTSQELTQTPDMNSSLDVTERFYKEEPIYDMQTEKTTTYISNMEEIKPQKKITLKISKDTQVLLLMVVVIFIFILILPVISNFFNGLGNN